MAASLCLQAKSQVTIYNLTFILPKRAPNPLLRLSAQCTTAGSHKGPGARHRDHQKVPAWLGCAPRA